MLKISPVLRLVLMSFIHLSSSASDFNTKRNKGYHNQDEDIGFKHKKIEYYHKYNNNDNNEDLDYSNNNDQYQDKPKQQHAGQKLNYYDVKIKMCITKMSRCLL